MIADETIQTVRDRVRIADIVGERVRLKRRGRNLLGLCPFHKEKTPSFNVNEERNFYHCFGCGASGDAIRFVQETEGLTFIEAIRELAQSLNIDIVETTDSSAQEQRQHAQARERREALYALNQAAAEYFVAMLETHELAHHARTELERRGLELSHSDVRDALTSFHVGYAPHGWDGLAVALRRGGHSVKAAEELGLLAARKSASGHYDRFRHRLMFSVCDLRGRIVGFSGRTLPAPSSEELQRLGLPSLNPDAEPPAKYINSPESAIYKKRQVVFGLYQARTAIRQEDHCVLVEGNLDVVSLHARGMKNVAAPLGTAFTPEQAQELRRYSANVVLLFDGDSAGRRASAAARKPIEDEALAARVASLPRGVDPDDLAKTRGIEAVRACVQSAQGMLEYLIASTLDEGFKSDDPQAQARKIQQVVDLLRSEEDPTTRALAQSQADIIASRLGIRDVRSFQALQRAIAGAARPAPPQIAVRPPESARSVVSRSAIDDDILGALVEYPQVLEETEVINLLAFASGKLALDIAQLSRSLPLSAELEGLREPLRSLVARHLAAPRHETPASALQVVVTNLRKLRRQELRRAKGELVQQLRQAVLEGDTDLELELLQAQAKLLAQNDA